MTLSLQGLVSIAAKEQGHKEIRIELVGNTDSAKREILLCQELAVTKTLRQCAGASREPPDILLWQ
jgi:putative Mg2+ transporter-C (MgtC) family protein